jgi:hypothetical protein
VLHRDDHLRQAGDVVAAAGSRQTGYRMPSGATGITDERAVEVAILVNLRTAHKTDIDIAALQQKQHIGAAQHHIRAARAALLVGRRRQFSRLDERADDAPFEQYRQARGVQPLRQSCGQERDPDTREYDLAVTQQPSTHDREQLARGICGRAGTHPGQGPAVPIVASAKAGGQGHLVILRAWGPLFEPGAGSGCPLSQARRGCVLVVMDARPAAASVEEFLEPEQVEVFGP